MQITIELRMNGVRDDVAEILIALLGEAGFEAFEEKEDSLSAYISESSFNREAVDTILRDFVSDYELQQIAPRNWNAEWEQQYQPVVVDRLVGVRAGFHPPIDDVETEIIITPKMSFGTGHHATTWQMLQMMSRISFQDKRVFDYGSGTGVLAIYARKLGAASVMAMDIDDWCIENALENAQANGCADIKIIQGEKPISGMQFDILLANINRHILVESMNAMSAALSPGGYLLLSGFYADENDLLLRAALENDVHPISVSEKNNWSCLLLQKSINR